MNGRCRNAALMAAVVLASCTAVTQKEPLRITPKSEVASSPVVREVLPPAAPAPVATPPVALPPVALPPVALPPVALPPVAPAPVAPPAAAANPESGPPTLASVAPQTAIARPPSAPAIVAPQVPPGTLYVCRSMVNGQLQHTAIEFEPRVRQLCSRHPEMSVCQYEREACRNSGGRVFDAAGTEITPQIEAEYDRKVMRARFRS